MFCLKQSNSQAIQDIYQLEITMDVYIAMIYYFYLIYYQKIHSKFITDILKIDDN